MMRHDEHGWGCGCCHFLGGFLWVMGLIALVLYWVASSDGVALGIEASFWLGSAIALGILAIPLKLRGHGIGCDCGVCK